MVLCVCATGCEREGWKPKEADRRQIVVDGTNMTLQTGSVGTGKHEKEATYVLVDAKNPSDMDLSVTLGGQFLDQDDKVVGLMIRQSLRIPSKGVRTFALVNEERVANARATGATIEVTSAVQLDYEEQITITDLHEYKDGDRIVVKGYVRNTVGRIGRAVVFATFYDAKGRPMKRPSTVFRLERKAKRGVQFVGPPGSVRATLSVGDIVY
jgi:hypothetical protein